MLSTKSMRFTLRPQATHFVRDMHLQIMLTCAMPEGSRQTGGAMLHDNTSTYQAGEGGSPRLRGAGSDYCRGYSDGEAAVAGLLPGGVPDYTLSEIARACLLGHNKASVVERMAAPGGSLAYWSGWLDATIASAFVYAGDPVGAPRSGERVFYRLEQ